MTIDVGTISLQVQECLLAILLVGDWNVRAWTLLESMRGRRSIYILYEDNEIVSLKDTLLAVHSFRSIDLAIFLLTAQENPTTSAPPSRAAWP